MISLAFVVSKEKNRKNRKEQKGGQIRKVREEKRKEKKQKDITSPGSSVDAVNGGGVQVLGDTTFTVIFSVFIGS